MPPRVLPTFTAAEVQKHNSAASCYVTYAGRVFDVTSFVQDHPGGGDLILEYAGKNVQTIMEDEASHFHSEAAYEVLEDLVVGRLVEDGVAFAAKVPQDGVEGEVSVNRLKPLSSVDAPHDASQYDSVPASEEALSMETDAVSDYRRHKFLDLDRPLLMQVWNGGFSKEFYLAQVHRPRHYKSGQSAPLFGNFLEPLSKTPWWVIPSLWLPPVVYGTILSRDGLSSWAQVAAFWLVGLAIWTFVEYGLHRCLFHIDG
jgi:4-hydroxysphinganine ceramide fatty acyl 2-hydroxylase